MTTPEPVTPTLPAKIGMINRSMRDSDHWAIKIRYEDAEGEITDRFVSPIKWFDTKSFLALCLSRESPRRFYIDNIHNLRAVPAHELQMPTPIVVVRPATCLTLT
jgi:predicted DNA-binding transcriptional regulator YafY